MPEHLIRKTACAVSRLVLLGSNKYQASAPVDSCEQIRSTSFSAHLGQVSDTHKQVARSVGLERLARLFWCSGLEGCGIAFALARRTPV